jgi:hypothetical protein
MNIVHCIVISQLLYLGKSADNWSLAPLSTIQRLYRSGQCYLYMHDQGKSQNCRKNKLVSCALITNRVRKMIVVIIIVYMRKSNYGAKLSVWSYAFRNQDSFLPDRSVWCKIRKSNKNKQYNAQTKRTNNDLQNTTQKTKDWATHTQQKPGCSGMVSSSCRSSSNHRVTKTSFRILIYYPSCNWPKGKKGHAYFIFISSLVNLSVNIFYQNVYIRYITLLLPLNSLTIVGVIALVQ